MNGKPSVSELKFRNLAVTPEDPVEKWGVEGLLTAIDRGSLRHWRRIIDAVRADPNGRWHKSSPKPANSPKTKESWL